MSKKIRQQFADTMLEVGQKDPNLIVLLGDISHFIMQPFAKACSGRFYNIGICEPTIVSMAAGLAKVGFYPVVHTIAPFILERSFEQLKLDFCYQQMPGNLISVGSAFDYSNLGCTHHCYDDFTLMKSLPNTQIFYPASCNEFDILFKKSYNNSHLTLFRIPENQHEQEIDPRLIEVGKAIKISEGNDLTLVALGPQLKNAVDARKILAKEGWDIEIIYIHTVLPLDIPTIRESVKKTKKVLIVEEHNRFGGTGYDILNAISDIENVQTSSIAIDGFVHDYGSYEEICDTLGFSVDGIIQSISKFRR
ncbi:MAG: transketolase C-terminal domain-containing protein [Methylococcaceae bacterium]|jgi:transketolase